MPKRRLGIALLMPSPVDVEVDALRRALGDKTLERIPPHLTLVPPVNVREDRMDDALRVLRAAAAQVRPFELRLGPPRTFLPVNPVLYLEVSRDLGPLRTLRDAVFVEPLERKLTWPWVPHVTIADEAAPDRIEAALTALHDFRAVAVFDRVHLLEEGPGRRWEPIADAPFAGPVVVGRGPLELDLAVGERLDPDAAAFSGREWRVYDDATYGDDWAPKVPFAVSARRMGDVVGIAVGWTVGSYGYLSTLLVAAAHRGEGIGGHLLRAVEDIARSRGCDRLDLRTPTDERAAPFYRERGYVDVTVLPNERWGRDFVQLRRTL